MSYIFNPNQEQFKTIQDYPDYEIGDHGTVRSLKYGKVRVLKAYDNGRGYLKVGWCKDGKQNRHYIHRLVAQAFIQNPESKPTVNHINGIKTDNRSINLEFATRQEQTDHIWNHPAMSEQREIFRQTGLNNVGENHGRAKLSDVDCDLIKIKYATGNFTQKEIGEEFDVNPSQISRIVRGKRRSRPTPQNIQ